MLNTIQCCDYRPISCECSCAYIGLAFDASNFYMTCADCCQIHKYDLSLKMRERIQVCRSYGSICFDLGKDCFWAICPETSNHIYQLDRNFQEMTCFTVQPSNCNIQITGIDCDGADFLLICGNFGIAKVPKSGESQFTLIEEPKEDTQYCAIAAVACGFAAAYHKQKQRGIIWKDAGCRQETQYCLPDCYDIKDLASCRADDGYCIYVLAVKDCGCSYLTMCKLCCPCGNPCRDIPGQCPWPGGSDCSKSAAEIIRSIASVETALSHILNAEGEKIQTILCHCTDPCQIRQVNGDVYKMVMGITQLEQILYAKMQAAVELCDDEQDC